MKFSLILVIAIIGVTLAAPECPKEEDRKVVLLPHESDCTKFYICSHGRPHEFSCPHGLFFSPEKQRCDWPNNVDCTQVTTTPGNPETTTSDEDY
uniref:Putative peritrophin n=1 Tax=Nyssomyia neivai TaxID=330878 RepID=A0A1L8E3S2_9DIPT